MYDYTRDIHHTVEVTAVDVPRQFKEQLLFPPRDGSGSI